MQSVTLFEVLGSEVKGFRCNVRACEVGFFLGTLCYRSLSIERAHIGIYVGFEGRHSAIGHGS